MSGFAGKQHPIYTLKLPWPPSINNYYGTTRTGKRFIGRDGVEFRNTVIESLREIAASSDPLSARLQVWVECFPPDKRKRDLDNVKKALLDALTHAGVYKDDCLIDDLRSVRREVSKPGYVIVHIGELEE